jgi:hypothetical protein
VREVDESMLKKLKIDRIISIATLIASLVAIILVLKKPAPVAQPQTPAAIAAHAQSFDQKMSQLQQAAQAQQPAPTETSPSSQSDSAPSAPSQPAASSSEQPKPAVRLSSDEVGAALAQALGVAADSTSALSPDSNIGSSAPTIKDQQISFDGDVVHGQFLTEIAGKDVWITVSGHLGSKDGYATFDPIEFKVGDLDIPVSLVNSALQKKMAEQHDRLKLPDYVGGVKVENGQLVMQPK